MSGLSITADKVFCRDTADHLTSNSSLQIVSSWIKMCQKHHPACDQKEIPLPTHVLDVSRSDPVLVNGKRKSPKYIALNHCWGTEPTLTTTLPALHERQRRIPTEILPASFRDAVIITKRLGVKYLWIDSRLNWRLEASRHWVERPIDQSWMRW